MAAITCLMPVKNGGKYLSSILGAILSMVEMQDEILVIDDGSDDGSPQILDSFSKSFKNLSWYRNPGNGIVDALNFGVSQAKNEWVARFDVDDQYDVTRLNRQREVAGLSVSVIFSDYSCFASNGANLGFFPSPIFDLPTKVSLIHSSQTAHPVAMFNKAHFIECGGYRKQDFPAEDLSLWLRMSRQGDLISLPNTLLNYQISVSSTLIRNLELARKKKWQLLRDIGIDRNSIMSSSSWLSNSLDTYDSTPFATTRKLIALRNQIALQDFYEFCPRISKFNIAALSLDIAKNPLAIVEQIYFQRKRRIFRAKVLNPNTFG